jgi:EmrB/QacA subfamily drug resistance transporter
VTQLAVAVGADEDQRRAHPKVVFVLTALGSFMAALDLSIVNVAFPDLEADFAGTRSAVLAWVITAYTIVFGALLVTGGRTADRLGRRRTFQLGVGLFVVASALCGLAANVPMLIAARAVQGIGAAFLVPASVALLIAAYPPARRTQMVALWGGIGALAVATGPSLGAALVSAGGWRWAFFVNLPVGAAILLLGRRYLIESEPEPAAARPDYPGVGLATISIAAVVLAISEGPEWGWGDPKVWAALAIGLALGVAFVRRSGSHPAPVLDLTLFRDRTFSTANTATFVYALAFFPMLLGNILFLTGVWNYPIMRAGLAVTPGPLVVAVIAGPAGKLAGRVGFRWLLLAGATCMAAGLLSYVWLVDAEPDYVSHWLPGTLIVGLGIGLSFPVLSAAAVASLPAHRYAVGSAVNQTARQVGGSVGIAVLVVLLGDAAGVDQFHLLWLWAAGAALASGVIGATIPHRASAAAR